LKWFERLSAHAAGLLEKGCLAVLAGDYNVIPTERDVYKPERWVDDALFLPETREAYRQLLAQGWTDSLRHLHPDEVIYTFWDYMRGAFPRRGPSHRPPAPESGAGAAAEGRGRGQGRAGDGEDERPRADVDRIAELSLSTRFSSRSGEPPRWRRSAISEELAT
jgi:hypothetical protein